jgi:DNA anti-recombination protein RmuC
MDRQPYEQTYRLIQQLADPFTEQLRAAARASHNEYVPTNLTHQQLARLSQRAHELAAAGDEQALKAVEDEVDRAAAELWGITDEELAEIQRSLEELRR